MRILGIDPGLQTTGFGVIDAHGHSLQYVASGTISTLHLERGDLPARLKVLFDGIGELHARYAPDAAAIEIVFVNVNPQSTLLLGQARGACLTALVTNALPVAEYTPMQMKQAVAGTGRAAKTQVQHMVQRLLQLPGLPGDHPRACIRRHGAHPGSGQAGAAQHRGLQDGAGDLALDEGLHEQRREEHQRRPQRPLQHDEPEALVLRLSREREEREADPRHHQQQQDDGADDDHATRRGPAARNRPALRARHRS
jgi:crossover junction endodeoxyribonuclease RuvC